MRILLIEDEPKIAGAIKRGLLNEGHIAEIHNDGDTGLAAALTDEYDVIILDRMLPNVEGVEICRQVRSAKVKTPILFLTAKTRVRDRVEGLDAGADDYLVKPFSFEELLARIRALLRRPRNSTDCVLTIDDLSLNPADCVVRRAGKVIDLSRTEFRLLEYLMRNARQIISKDKIIEHVWDFDADILPNTVEAYIGYLRQKIDKPFRNQLIKTVRGFGYKLDGESE